MTHVPDQTSTILSSRTLPRCDSGLPRNTQNCTGIMGNVFERPPAQEGHSSKIFNNSKNLASSFQDLRPDNSEKERRGMKRESLNTPIQSPHFQSISGILDHIGGTYSHVGMMDYPRVPITAWNLGKFPHAMEFQSWKLNFRTEVCMRTAESQVTMLWIKEFVSYSIDELVTSRSITGQHNPLATRSQSSEKELVSKSNELKTPTDSYEEDKLRT